MVKHIHDTFAHLSAHSFGIRSLSAHSWSVKVLFGATLLFLTACGDFLEEYSQDTDYVRSWNDLDELLIGDCYLPVMKTYSFSQMQNDLGNYGTCLHLLGDEVQEINVSSNIYTDYDNHEREFGYYTWQQRTGQNESYSDFFEENRDWKKIYKCINVANNILNSVTDVPQTTLTEKQGVLKVSGEAHFLRGLYYFWLTNLYGKPYDPNTASSDPGVPLKTSEQVLDIKYQRNSVQECYNQVLTDLLAARNELSQYATSQKSIYRADSTTVNLLLSRVYLYMQNWQKAAEYAQRVISAHASLQNLNTNTDKFALKTNAENIFSMGGDDVPRLLYQGMKGLKVSNDLYSSYSNNDLRKQRWFWNYGTLCGVVKEAEGASSSSGAANTSDSKYYIVMYCDGWEAQQAPVSSIFLFRSAEAYLNLAEAEAYMGNDSQAQKPLLTLMKARYTTSSPELDIATTSGTSLITLIRNERRRELAFEGQRWFDLRRYRVCSVQPQKISITHDYTYYTDRTSNTKSETRRFVLTQDDASWTLPIPHEVLEFNTGMQNNDNQWRTYTVLSE